MNLKRSDKIIAIAGVIIIIIAAVGIFAYYSMPEEEKDEEPKVKTFDIMWTKEQGDDRQMECYAGKTYSETITIDAPSRSVLTSVEFKLSWEDDNTYGLIPKGLDTLTAEISLMGGESKEDSSTGSGNFTFLFSVNDIPAIDSVEAEDIFEAENTIGDTFSDKDKASFNIDVTVVTGEKLRRPLKYLRDKGNDFDIKISYTYYRYNVEEPEEDQDLKPTGQNDYYIDEAIREFRSMCWGRGII